MDSEAGASAGGSASSAGSSGKAGNSPGGGGVSVGPDTALDDLPHVYAGVLCDVLERCWTAFSDATAGREGCVRTLERIAEDGLFAPLHGAVADGRVAYEPAELPGCLHAIESTSCADFSDLFCPKLFVGSKQTGETCELDAECADGGQCLVDASCPGKCGPAPRLGEPCSSHNRCAAGSSCALNADGAQVCVAPAQLNESCGTFLPCAGLLYCKDAETGAMDPDGTCVERGLPHDGELGAECDGLGVERLCGAGLVCTIGQENGESVGRCQPQAEVDGACTFSMPDACPASQYCHIQTDLGVKPATGQCVPRPELGEACRYGTIYVAPCRASVEQVCHPDSGVCVTAKRLGQPCTHGAECVSGDCGSNGQCASLLECEEAAARAM